MTVLYALRHPETTWNLTERYQGRQDSPLSERGENQANLAARAFSEQSIDAIFSSPLSRARYLADAIAGRTTASVTLDDRLSEIAMGPWEGLYRAEIEERYPALYRQWYETPESVCFPDGESLTIVKERVLSWAEETFSTFPAGHVVLVSHSAVVQALVGAALTLDLRYTHRLRISNASVTILCGMEAPGSLLSLNSTEALYGSPVQCALAQDCVSWRRRSVIA